MFMARWTTINIFANRRINVPYLQIEGTHQEVIC